MTKTTQAAPAAFVVHRTEMVAAGKLNPAAYNPRRIKQREFLALKESIRLNGFVEPLVVRREGMEIIGGHQRLRALKELCEETGQALPKLPCVVLDVGERQAKMLNVALNRISGDFDETRLARVIDAVMMESPMSQAEVIATGFRQSDIEKYVDAAHGAIEGDGPEDGAAFARSVTMSIAFDTVEQRDATRGLLMEMAKRRNIKTGTLVRLLLDKEVH